MDVAPFSWYAIIYIEATDQTLLKQDPTRQYSLWNVMTQSQMKNQRREKKKKGKRNKKQDVTKDYVVAHWEKTFKT